MSQLLVFYDERCGICSQIAFVLSKLTPADRVVYKKAREMEQFTNQKTALQNRYRDIHSIANGMIFKGYDTYLQIAKKTPWLWPISALMQFAWMRFIGEKTYRHIAAHRACGLNEMKRSEKP